LADLVELQAVLAAMCADPVRGVCYLCSWLANLGVPSQLARESAHILNHAIGTVVVIAGGAQWELRDSRTSHGIALHHRQSKVCPEMPRLAGPRR
jgi:hypothetical protein